MDLSNLFYGILFLLTGIILLLIKIAYFKNKDGKWLYYGNIQLISGAILGIVSGIYFIVSSF